jgi:hypothetical protein
MSYTNTISQVRIYVGWNDSDAGSIYIQDAQLEQGLVATDYIETGASTAQAGILEDLPRLDYSGGASCPSLLLEPSRTNVFSISEYIGDYNVVANNILSKNDDVLSPEGVYNGWKCSRNVNSAGYVFNTTANIAPSTTYTYSVFFKAKDLNICNEISLQLHPNSFVSKTTLFSFETGTTSGDGIVEPFGNGWYRVSLTGTTLSSIGYFKVGIQPYLNGSPTIGGSDGDVLYYGYGQQLEAGSYPTSYIPTYGSAVTRSADNIAQLDLRPTNLTGDKFTYMLDITLNTAIATFSGYFNEVDSVGNFKAGFVYSNGLQWRTPVATINQYITLDSQIAVGDRAKMLVVVDGIIRKVFYNGSLITTLDNCDNNGADTDGIRPYYGSSNAQFFSPSYNQILVFDTALTDSECIALTTL